MAREPFEEVVVVLAKLVEDGARLTFLGRSQLDFVRCLDSVLGGRAGSSHSPQAGAFILPLSSSDFVLAAITRGPLDSFVVRGTTSSLLSWVSFLTGRGGGFRFGRRGGPVGMLALDCVAVVLVTFSFGRLNDFCLMTGLLGSGGFGRPFGSMTSVGDRPMWAAFNEAIRSCKVID